MDPVKNFAKVSVYGGYDSDDVSIALESGEGAKLPAPGVDGAFNLVWWNSTDFGDPAEDVNVEIVRCTARTGDILTITRAQESTSASTKNTSGKSYSMILGVTKKTIDDFVTLIATKQASSEKGQASGYASLDSDAKVPAAQLPDISISDTFVVASQVAMLALTAQVGDVAVRSDLNKTYILKTAGASVIANWQELLTPTDSVTSVAGRTGVVTLTKTDVGLANVDNTADASKPVSTAQQTAIDAVPRNFLTVGFSQSDYIVDGTADDVQIQQAIDAVVALGGGTVMCKAGTYDISASLSIAGSNVRVIGAGVGNTIFRLNASVTDSNQLLKAIPTNVATGYALTVNAALGDLTLTMSSGDASNLAAGDYILLRSGLDIDTENAGRKQGDLYKVRSVAGGVVTLGVSGDGMTVREAFTTANNAAVDKLTFYKNIHIEGITFQDADTSRSNSLVSGQVDFRYIDNLSIVDCQFKDMFYAGLRIYQCWNAKVRGCDFRDIKDTTPTQNTYYGVEVRGASTNVAIENCTFHNMRHGVTQGAGGSTVLAGRTRNLSIVGNTSSATTTAHFDCHQGADTVVISGNTMTGDDAASNAIQTRSPACITGNTILGVLGKGISLFGAASGSVVSGNYIKGCTYGVAIDTGITNCLIANNIITQCTSYGIQTVASGSAHGGDDCIITGNYIYGNVTGTYCILLDSCSNVFVSGNKLKNNTAVRILTTHVVGTNVVVQGNFFSGLGGTPMSGFDNSSTHIINDNFGYNLKGASGLTIATPFPTGAGNIMNYASTNSAPDSNVLYTNVHSPKNITITGGTVSDIEVNGIASGGASGGAFKLGIGDTIKVIYTVAPTVVVKIA